MIKLALHGKKESGKSTAANYLVDLYGVDVFSFAHNLKVDLAGMGVPWDVINKKPWPKWLRVLAQLYGMYRRDQDPNYWINRFFADVVDADPEAVVVDDLRFRNEADALKRNGYTLIKLVKAGHPDDDPHPSEKELDDYDGFHYTIEADPGDLLTIFEALDEILAKEELNA